MVDAARRAYWTNADGLERPALPELGYVEGDFAFGLPEEGGYVSARDGPYDEWQRRKARKEALAAEALRLWEEKSRADAAAWRKRVEETGGDPNYVAPAPE